MEERIRELEIRVQRLKEALVKALADHAKTEVELEAREITITTLAFRIKELEAGE